MPSEQNLLRSLDDEPRTPSTVDIRRAIAAGRRRRARRGVGYAGAAVVTAVVVAGASAIGGLVTPAPYVAATGTPRTPASATASSSALPKGEYTIPGTADFHVPAAAPPTGCTITRLPAPDNAPMALVSAADPSGRYLVGRSYPREGGYQAVIWHDGKARKVMLPGDLEEGLADVNSAGTAVGWSYVGDGEKAVQVPFVYRDGKVSKLPGVQRGSTYAINDAGAIVGDDDSGHALVWPSATAKPIRLPAPAGTSRVTARDIDEDGTTVGTLGYDKPYVWFPNGTHRALPLPDLDGKPVAARVFAIRNGWATGVANLVDGADKGTDPGSSPGAGGSGRNPKNDQIWAVRWNVRTGEVRVVDELNGSANAVNAHGWQVGINKPGRAVLVTDTATVVLPALADHKPGGLTNIPNAVSDDGRTIAGQSDDETGTIQAAVWRCL